MWSGADRRGQLGVDQFLHPVLQQPAKQLPAVTLTEPRQQVRYSGIIVMGHRVNTFLSEFFVVLTKGHAMAHPTGGPPTYLHHITGRQLASLGSHHAVVWCGGPAGEECERVMRGGTGLGGVGGHREPGVGWEWQLLEREGKLADDGMAEALGAVVVEADVVGDPAGAELVAAGGELTHEVGQVAVAWVASVFGAQDGDGGVGDVVPVDEEVGPLRVDEREAGQVRRCRPVVEGGCQQGATERVGGNDVEAPVAHQRRGAGHRIQESLHPRAYVLLTRSTATWRRGVVRRAGQLEEMGAFGLVELQGTGDGFEDAVGHTGEIPALEPRVVVDADPGQDGALFATQPGHAPVGAVSREPHVVQGEAGATGARNSHPSRLTMPATLRPPRRTVGGSVITWNAVTFSAALASPGLAGWHDRQEDLARHG